LREPGAAPEAATTPALREALEEALLRIWNRGLFRRGLVVLDHGPARYRPAAPVAPGFVAVRVYPLGEAGQDLGHSIEVQDRATRARPEIREYALGEPLLVHIVDAILAHPAEGVPGVGGRVVVVVDANLLAREELLAVELLGRTPLPRRHAPALLAQEATQSPEEFFATQGYAVRHVLGPPLPPQQCPQVVQRTPVFGQR
jgi:hypothetical protein